MIINKFKSSAQPQINIYKKHININFINMYRKNNKKENKNSGNKSQFSVKEKDNNINNNNNNYQNNLVKDKNSLIKIDTDHNDNLIYKLNSTKNEKSVKLLIEDQQETSIEKTNGYVFHEDNRINSLINHVYFNLENLEKMTEEFGDYITNVRELL
jgi:hypothetical protein